MADRHLGLEDIVFERFDFNVSVPLVSIREDVNAHARCFRSRVRMRQRACMRGCSRSGRFLPKLLNPAATNRSRHQLRIRPFTRCCSRAAFSTSAHWAAKPSRRPTNFRVILFSQSKSKGAEMTTFTKRKKINFLWIVSGEALAFLLVVAASGFAHVATRRPLPPFTANKGELLQKLPPVSTSSYGLRNRRRSPINCSADHSRSVRPRHRQASSARSDGGERNCSACKAGWN